MNLELPEWLPIVLLIAAVLTLLAGLCIADNIHHNKLMQQCLNDGHKEYECEAMLKTYSSTTFIPIYTH